MKNNFLSHELQKEFPDLAQRVEQLKAGNPHFARRLDDYNGLDKDIVKVEDGKAAMEEFRLEELKKKRLQLKDELYQLLKTGN